jgi:hypothetical protein
MQNGVEYDPDTNVISVRNATSLANTHRAIAAAGWKKQTAGARPNPAAAGQAMQAGDTAYQLGEGVMDKLKSLVVPKLLKMLGPDQAAQIANTVKQVTGGDLTPSKENSIKVARAFGFDKMQPPSGQAQQMAEGIAGNWQGKLIQLLYSVGTIGGMSMAGSSMTGTFLAVIGGVLLLAVSTVFGDAPGQIGTMGNFGNKGTDTNKGLDDHGMPIRTNEDDLARMMEMAGVKKKAVDEEKTEEGNKFTGNLAKARAAGKKEADLDGDGDMEKVQENIASLSQLFRSFK